MNNRGLCSGKSYVAQVQVFMKKEEIELIVRVLQRKIEQKELFTSLNSITSDQEYSKKLGEILAILREEFQKEYIKKNQVASIWSSLGHAFSVIQVGDDLPGISAKSLHKKDKYELFDLLARAHKKLTLQAASVS